MGAGETLRGAALAALAEVAGLSGAFTEGPVQAAFPYATADAGLESDWSHKSGQGREVRLAVTVRDEGERPGRLGALVAAAEEALEAMSSELEGWRVVTFRFVRSRTVRESKGRWSAVIEYRARLLATGQTS